MLAKEIVDKNFKSALASNSNSHTSTPSVDRKILQDQIALHRKTINSAKGLRSNFSSEESKTRVLIEPEVAVLDMPTNDSDSLWNEQLEEEFMELAENCRRDAQNCLLRYRKYRKYDDALRIGSITLGGFVVIASISSLDPDIRQIFNVCLGAFSSLLAGISSITKYARKSEAEKNAYFQLNKLALNIHIELNRPLSVRIPPNIYVTTVSDQREKFLTNTQLDLP